MPKPRSPRYNYKPNPAHASRRRVIAYWLWRQWRDSEGKLLVNNDLARAAIAAGLYSKHTQPVDITQRFKRLMIGWELPTSGDARE